MRAFLIRMAAAVLLVCSGPAVAQTPPAGGYTGPLFPNGEAVVNTGEIGKTDPIVSIPVRYSFTGVLEEPVRNIALLSGTEPLPAGQPMFAVIMANQRGETVRFWCTHRLRPLKNMPKARTTICLPQLPNGAYLWTIEGSLLPSYLTLNRSNGASPPKVKLGPADFGSQMTLSYRLVEFDAKDVDIDLYLSIDGYETGVGQIHLTRQPDGSALLPLMGGVIRLTQDGKDRKSARAEVLAPLSATSPNVMVYSR